MHSLTDVKYNSDAHEFWLICNIKDFKKNLFLYEIACFSYSCLMIFSASMDKVSGCWKLKVQNI